MIETIFEKNKSTTMEQAGSITYTAASHQELMEILWLHFWGSVMSSIYSLVHTQTLEGYQEYL